MAALSSLKLPRDQAHKSRQQNRSFSRKSYLILITCILEQWMKNHMHSANSSLIELAWYQCANFGTAQERSWMAQWFHSIQDGRRIAVCTYLERLFSACLRLPHHLCIMTSSNVPTDSDLDRLLRKLKSALRWSHNFCQYVSVCLVWHQQHLVIL